MCEKNCAVCGNTVDVDRLHPDSRPIPNDRLITVMHAGCANRVDPANEGVRLTKKQLMDQRAWIQTI